ncbi:MAG TPA: class I SAM-dependent methyltransferase [Blastocatellia bacterium]|nr:class I SAM-dependent methyltransferase [Blastocatellia bacterium]
MARPFSEEEAEESTALRCQYEQHGVENYYAQFGVEYRNPHEPIIAEVVREAVLRWKLDTSCVLDLACGSGEITLALREFGAEQVDGIDPFTGEAYQARTGKHAEAFSFEDVAAGALSGRRYSLVACSFAMHLLEESWLPSLLFQLGEISDSLLILTPHKRPELKAEWGLTLLDEFMIERVRARLYRLKT